MQLHRQTAHWRYKVLSTLFRWTVTIGLKGFLFLVEIAVKGRNTRPILIYSEWAWLENLWLNNNNINNSSNLNCAFFFLDTQRRLSVLTNAFVCALSNKILAFLFAAFSLQVVCSYLTRAKFTCYCSTHFTLIKAIGQNQFCIHWVPVMDANYPLGMCFRMCKSVNYTVLFSFYYIPLLSP